MRLALKLTLYIWLGILVVLGVNGYTRFLRESKLFETDMAQDHGIMGRGIAGAISTVWEDEGRQRALDVVERVNKKENDITIRFVELERGTEPTTIPAAPPETMQEVARGNIVTWINRSGEGHLYSYVPIYLDKNLMGAVELSEPLTAQRAYIRNSLFRLGVTTGGMALVAGLISVAIGVLLIGRPVQALALRARRIGSGDFSPGVFVTQSDELGYLGNEIESMALQLAEARDRVEAESRALAEATEQLRRAERVSTVGKLAAGVAHELGTPLNVITWRTKKIWSGKVEGEEARENARIAFEQCERITRIVRQLLDFGRQQPPEIRELDLVALVEATLGLLEPVSRKAGVSFQVHVAQRPFRVVADASQIQQVLTNLFLNAIQAMPTGGAIHIHLELVRRTAPPHVALAGQQWARIRVQDQGTGISKEHLPHIFDPFYTTKKVGEGTGLGLSVAWGIVSEHGGWISVESPADAPSQSGTIFDVFLPEKNP